MYGRLIKIRRRGEGEKEGMLSSLNLSHNGAPTPFQSIFDFYEMTVLFFVSDDGLCWIFRSKFGINQWWSGHSIMGGAYFQIVVSQNSIQSRCVIWDPFSSDLGSICDTICLQTRVLSTIEALDLKTQCGWQSTEKKDQFYTQKHHYL